MSNRTNVEASPGAGKESPPDVTRPAEGRPSPRTRWVVTGAIVAGLGALAVRDPAQSGSYGLCPLLAVTGLDCPFCGGLRGTHDLLHGNVATALDHNLLLPLYLFVLVAMGVLWWRGSPLLRQGALRRHRWLRGSVWSLVAVTAVFFVVRNLPWFPYLDSSV